MISNKMKKQSTTQLKATLEVLRDDMLSPELAEYRDHLVAGIRAELKLRENKRAHRERDARMNSGAIGNLRKSNTGIGRR